MNLNSKYFDMIRIARPQATKHTLAEATKLCDWAGCKKRGEYPAPSPGHQGAQTTNTREHKRNFCATHIGDYNKSYDFFEGMTDEDMAQYRRAATTGHRPTWNLGVRRAKPAQERAFEDPLDILADKLGEKTRKKRGKNASAAHATPSSEGQRRALDALNLNPDAQPPDVRKQYKQLVKQYHPDTNGGDRTYEDRFQKTVQAYQYLRASGFC